MLQSLHFVCCLLFYSNNVLDSTKAFRLLLTNKEDIEGLPDSLLQLMATNAAAEDPTK